MNEIEKLLEAPPMPTAAYYADDFCYYTAEQTQARDAEIADLRAYAEQRDKAIEYLEAALKVAFPHGASGEVYNLWNKARVEIFGMKGNLCKQFNNTTNS